MGYNWAKKNMSEQTGYCKCCGKEMPLERLRVLNGYCCPICYQKGQMQRDKW